MDHREHTERLKTKKAVFRAHGVPPSQMHPTALQSGRQLSTQLGTAGGAGCGLPSGSLPAACTAALWTGVYNSSPSESHTESVQPRKLRPRSSKVFRCLAPTTCLHNLRGWGLHNLLSIIWEVCGSPDLTPVGPNLESGASFLDNTL